MGSFGTGPFENDDALDFLGELGEVGNAAIDDYLVDLNKQSLSSRSTARVVALAYLVFSSANECIADTRQDLLAASGVDLSTIREADTDLLRKSICSALKLINSPNCDLYREWKDAGRLHYWQDEIKSITTVLCKNLT